MRVFSAAICLCAASLACSDSDRFDAHGIVRGVDRDAGQVVVAHDPVVGLMDAMTMSFDAADAAQLDGLEPGAIVDFVIVADGRRFAADEIRVVGHETASGAASSFESLIDVGSEAPDFELIDQDGVPMSLASLRGRTVVLDFIYTNCPGPCPILTATHVSFQHDLPQDLRGRVRLVSVSLDPERDTPAALLAYGQALGADLSDWSFLTGEPRVVDSVLKEYGVGRVPGEDGEIDHVVATFVIGGDGRIARRYLGVDHRASDLAADVAQLARR